MSGRLLKRLTRLLAFFITVGIFFSFAGIAAANHRGDPNIGDIVISVPGTYSECSAAPFSDPVSVTNVGDRYLDGEFVVQYVTDSGRQTIDTIKFKVVGDWSGTVSYPPTGVWPVQANGTREIHVDVAVGVYDEEGGTKLGTIGSGHDWDVFCIEEPPPVIPEAPLVVIFPLVALGVGAIGYLFWRRRAGLSGTA